jgi:phage tail sheath protein FI
MYEPDPEAEEAMMTNQAKACLTFNAACDAALEMEAQLYKNLLSALRIVKDKSASEILQNAASVRLGIKQRLEIAALKGGLNEEEVKSAVPIMNLAQSIRCCDLHRITTGADNRKALAYSIQMFKDAFDFYHDMTERCSGAPMAQLFKSFRDDQTRYLQQLEDTYEEHFLTEG